jgi:hypothetical protein
MWAKHETDCVVFFEKSLKILIKERSSGLIAEEEPKYSLYDSKFLLKFLEKYLKKV